MARKSSKVDSNAEIENADALKRSGQLPENTTLESKNNLKITGYDSPPAYLSHKEWEEDRRQLGEARRDALNGFLKASIIQRSDLLRDLLAVSITIIFGALTLYFTSEEKIKTPWLFFFGIGVAAIGTAANLLARSEIIQHLQWVSHRVERNYLDIFETSRDVMRNPSQYSIDTANRVENTPSDFPRLKWIVDHGYRLVIWSLLICVTCLILSFSLTVHF